jgi:hypothetical protein
MPILKLTEETKEYFISSNLLSDDGIECPDDDIANICSLVHKSYEFYEGINKLNLGKLVQLYNFFDEYCISKGTIKLIEIAMTECTKYTQPTIFAEKKDGDKMTLFGYGNSIFDAKEFHMRHSENGFDNEYLCKITNSYNDTIDYTSTYKSGTKFEGTLKFVKLNGMVISFTECDWGEYIVYQYSN